MNHNAPRTLRLAGVLAAGALALAACGGSTDAPEVADTPIQSTSAAHLATGDGLAVYLFAPDGGGVSRCYGGCAKAWPPVPAGTKLRITSRRVDRALLGTTTRKDGVKQLTYAGHPLYRYVGDAKAGQTTGQGLDASGGLWWLVSAQGSAIKETTAGSSDSGGSGGYRY